MVAHLTANLRVDGSSPRTAEPTTSTKESRQLFLIPGSRNHAVWSHCEEGPAAIKLASRCTETIVRTLKIRSNH